MDKQKIFQITQPNNFDFLRLIAAMSVAIVHAMAHFNTDFFFFSDNASGVSWVVSGVPIFFVISGFLVYNSYGNCVDCGGLRQYVKNRLLRIAPAIYFYTFLIITFLIISGYTNTHKINLFWVISNLMLVPVYHPNEFSELGIGVLNGSLWTIPVELSFYFFVPLIYKFEVRFGTCKMLICVMTMALIGRAGLWYAYESGIEEMLFVKLYNISFIPHLSYFLIGICLLRVWKYISESSSNYIFICSVFVLILQYFLQINMVFFDELVYGIPLGFVCIYLAYKLPIIIDNCLKKIGDVSYGIYIWHMPIINIFIYYQVNHKITNGTLLIFIALCMTISIAIVSWRLAEKPALRLKQYVHGPIK